uniref:Heterotrimeric G-protein beta subunit n=1 Tax=Ganoderma boninense TaxID=34458 RepID=A0A5K1JRW1_9APHY|nr:Heterotrimeric G-protein beta subunit [Ganoderma boninense]
MALASSASRAGKPAGDIAPIPARSTSVASIASTVSTWSENRRILDVYDRQFVWFKNLSNTMLGNGEPAGTGWFESESESVIDAPPDFSASKDVRVGDVFCHRTPFICQLWLWVQPVDHILPDWEEVQVGYRHWDGRKLIQLIGDVPRGEAHLVAVPVARDLVADLLYAHSGPLAYWHEAMAYISLLNFSGHQDSVNAVAFSPDSRLLASGGDDYALFVVDVGTGLEIHKLAGKCPVTSLQWDCHITDKYQLFIGYANGQVLVASVDEKNFTGHLLPREGEGFVEDMAFGAVPGLSLLAICTGSDVEVWRESLSKTNQSSWSLVKLRLPPVPSWQSNEPVVPRSVHLTAKGAQAIVGYLAHGIIGRSAISADGTLLIVSNLYDGFDLYRLKDKVLLKTYTTQITENVPLPVIIMQNALDVDVLTGSSCGEIRIHHITSAAEDMHVLPHTNNLIQTLVWPSPVNTT